MPANYKEFDIADEYAAMAMEAREYLNIALHFGTLLAMLVYFAKDWQSILYKSYRYI